MIETTKASTGCVPTYSECSTHYTLYPLYLKHSDGQHRRFTEQFELQNNYNVAIEQNMQTVAQEYARFRALEETVEAMREELNSLSRARSDRAAQERVEAHQA